MRCVSFAAGEISPLASGEDDENDKASRLRAEIGGEKGKKKDPPFRRFRVGSFGERLKRGRRVITFPDESGKYRGNVPLAERAVLIATDSLGK